MTLQELQIQREKILAQIGSGAPIHVQSGSNIVKFDGVGGALRALEYIDKEIVAAGGTVPTSSPASRTSVRTLVCNNF